MIKYKLVPVDQISESNSVAEHFDGEKIETDRPEIDKITGDEIRPATAMATTTATTTTTNTAQQTPPAGTSQKSGQQEQQTIIAAATTSSDDGTSLVPLKSIDIGTVLSSIPVNLQHKAKAILVYLTKSNREVIPNSYRVVYEGGVIGSPLPKLLLWTISNDRKEDRSWDQFRFFRLLTDLAVPKSLFGSGKYKLANVSSKPVPIAIVKKRANNDNLSETVADQNAPLEKRWKKLF